MKIVIVGYALDSTYHYVLWFRKFYYTLTRATSKYHKTLWLDNLETEGGLNE